MNQRLIIVGICNGREVDKLDGDDIENGRGAEKM